MLSIFMGGLGSKKATTGSNTANPSNGIAAAAANVTANAATKSSNNVQVIFQGKIVTPQSLIQKKSYSKGESSYKKNKFVANDQTIDENATIQEGGNDKDKAAVGRKRFTQHNTMHCVTRPTALYFHSDDAIVDIHLSIDDAMTCPVQRGVYDPRQLCLPDRSH